MLSLIEKRPSDSYVRWVATSIFSGVFQQHPHFEDHLDEQIQKNPDVAWQIKDAIRAEAVESLMATLDKYERPRVDQLFYRIGMINGKMIHLEVDPELCNRLGFTTYQMNGKELSTDIVPAEHLAFKQECYLRAWSGEVVDYIGVGVSGQSYTAKLQPIYDNGVLCFVEVTVRILDRMKIDQDILDEVGEFVPTDFFGLL